MMWNVDQIQVVVQPQSVIHSMVEYEDGAVHGAAWHTGYETADSVCAVIIQSVDICRVTDWISGKWENWILKSRIWRRFMV